LDVEVEVEMEAEVERKMKWKEMIDMTFQFTSCRTNVWNSPIGQLDQINCFQNSKRRTNGFYSGNQLIN
jgi:hypothetical protein